MPHLKLFKRTWKYSEDEFVLSSLCQAMIRIILLIVASIFLLISPFWSNITGVQPQAIFITTVILCLIHIILYIVIAIVSGQGGVFETEKRKSLWIWLLLHVFITILELIFYCVSIWQVNDLYKGDKQEATYSEFVSVICWCSILMVAIVFEIVDWILHYDAHGRLKYKFYYTFLYDYNDGFKKTDDEKREIIKQIREVSHSKWKKLLQNMVASAAYDTEGERLDEAINAVSGAFVDFLTVSNFLMLFMQKFFQ
ncbi:unnamed protein product [Hymenolepis diminuta]|uniref:Uncharacterized protein n=1 Tax=Hymenolepis diminuta TaxID=6216 RepID=A0A564Y478_HYMDI|nr:unnamed protein product [Hymenolepis diminuta]